MTYLYLIAFNHWFVAIRVHPCISWEEIWNIKGGIYIAWQSSRLKTFVIIFVWQGLSEIEELDDTTDEIPYENHTYSNDENDIDEETM